MGASLSSETASPLAVAAVSEITQYDLDQLRVCQRMLLENIEPISASDTPTTSARVGDAPPSAAPEQVQPEQPLQHLQTTSRREPNLVQDEFLRALECADFYNSDRAILEQLFTLLDKTGEEMVNVHEILVGCCVLLKGGVAAKLQAAIEMLGVPTEVTPTSDNRTTSKQDLMFIIRTMTTVASYFGDPTMGNTIMTTIVNDVFSTINEDQPFTSEVVACAAKHPLICQYVQQNPAAT